MKHKFFRGLGAILFKEFIIVWRDPMTLFFMFFPPLIEMVAFGYALDNDVKHMAMLILNEDRTVESRQLIDRFVNTETFRVVGEVQSLEQLKSEMRKGRAYAALDIPPNFTRDLNAGHSAQVQLLVDGSNSTTALQALNTGLGVALTQSVESLLRDTGRQGVPIDIRPQMLYNPAMRAPNFYVPGVIGIVLQIAVHDHHGVTRRVIQPRRYRGLVAKVPGERNHHNPGILARGLAQHFKGLVGAPIVHENDFVRATRQIFEHFPQPQQKLQQNRYLIVDGNRDGETISSGHQLCESSSPATLRASNGCAGNPVLAGQTKIPVF